MNRNQGETVDHLVGVTEAFETLLEQSEATGHHQEVAVLHGNVNDVASGIVAEKSASSASKQHQNLEARTG